MGLRDDIEDTPGKEPVVERLTRRDKIWMSAVYRYAHEALGICRGASSDHLSAPVEAALHDFALGLDELIKETLGKVRDDQ